MIKRPVRYEHVNRLHGHAVWRDADGRYISEDFGNQSRTVQISHHLSEAEHRKRNEHIAECINEYPALIEKIKELEQRLEHFKNIVRLLADFDTK